MKLQESVKKESINVLLFSSIACVLMFLVFFILHQKMPDKVGFNYSVILGGLIGTAVACLNFFWMGLTVQRVVNTENQDIAYQTMRLSYRNRTLMQVLWLALCMLLPQIHVIAGILPLLFPGIFLKARGVLKRN